MINLISNYFGLWHLIISILLVILLIFLRNKKDFFNLKKIILILCIIDLSSYNFYILMYNMHDIISLLPIHFCYLTEIMIFAKIGFNIKIDTNLIFLNSAVGGIAGLVNNNLTLDMHSMFFFHHYIAHFILALFVIEFYDSIILSVKVLISSIIKTASLLIFALFFNKIFGTNYWFTVEKPEGNNLTLLFPESPGHLYLLIALGLFIYISIYYIYKYNQTNYKI